MTINGLNKNFLIGFGLVILALVFASFGALFIAVPVGIIGGAMAIIEMIKTTKP